MTKIESGEIHGALWCHEHIITHVSELLRAGGQGVPFGLIWVGVGSGLVLPDALVGVPFATGWLTPEFWLGFKVLERLFKFPRLKISTPPLESNESSSSKTRTTLDKK